MASCTPLPREKTPMEGAGPRGFPDCYHTACVLNSTFRYAKYIKKLRASEEEQRKGQLNNLKELKDKQVLDFFIRCDRRSLINNVARRVDLCMESYERDLEMKRDRMRDLFAKEEEADIRKFVEQAQAASETIWNEKMERLQYLLDKRKKEHEEKYKDTPLTKCTHVRPCIRNLREKEAQEIQLYQIKEKESMKMQEKEFDKMWHEVSMKESDALAARMEIDAIERYRRDMDCKAHSDMILAQREKQREIDRERLKQEQRALTAKHEADLKKEEEEEEARRQKRIETAIERKEAIAERQAILAQQKENEEVIRLAWDSLAGQNCADDRAKTDLIRRKKRELDESNRKMIELRDALNNDAEGEEIRSNMAQAQRDDIDRKRCNYLLWSQKTNRDVRKAMMDQIKEKEKAREELQKKLALENEYHEQLYSQLQQLVGNKAAEDARARKKHQQDLLKQIEYNKLLKERALQEEMDQRKKAAIAAKEYQDEINKMLCRPFFSDDVHPFMRQMAPTDAKMKGTCSCSKPTWCKANEYNAEEYNKL